MGELRAVEVGWLPGRPDDGSDQCAHGTVSLTVGDQTLVDPSDGEFTLSAAGLYLLRALGADHRAGDGLTDGNALFPCCGHSVFEIAGRCVVMGCDSGVDLSVTTDGDTVTLSRGDRSAVLARSDWRTSVLGFVEQVEAVYSRSVPRAAPSDAADAAGWRLFWEEWHARVRAAAEEDGGAGATGSAR
ncbi:hypothetical protein ABIC47_000598 [Leifsonia sp. 563]|uniref:hypothetical protein n=1 Tax=Leifsonia sp. 563 TaxID=3156412 RepID=UPI0033927ABE